MHLSGLQHAFRAKHGKTPNDHSEECVELKGFKLVLRKGWDKLPDSSQKTGNQDLLKIFRQNRAPTIVEVVARCRGYQLTGNLLRCFMQV